MKTFLIALFSGIFVAMLAFVVIASQDRSVLNVRPEVLRDPWFHATLADAYFGFITFYVWVAYKERNAVGRAVWFVLIMLLGNLAMSVYMVVQLLRLPPDGGVRELLLRPSD